MGLADKLKGRVKHVIERFSGEYSEPAPTERIPYQRGTPDENAEVVMARLLRPGAADADNRKKKKP